MRNAIAGLDRAASAVKRLEYHNRLGLCRDVAPGMGWHHHHLKVMYKSIASSPVGERYPLSGLRASVLVPCAVTIWIARRVTSAPPGIGGRQGTSWVCSRLSN